jgi:hypothetical protein
MMRPNRYLLWMAVILIAVAAALVPIGSDLARFFNASPVLNGIILLVLIGGIAYVFAQVLMLRPEVRWAEAFRAKAALPERPPPLMRTAARVLGASEGRRQRLTASMLRSLVDQIGLRLEERRDIARYIVAVLVLLGLMGTFWGLINTVEAVIDAIRGLTVGASDDFVRTFERFKSGLLDTLKGSGVAFSCAMFGLGGSLILGALEVQAQHAQNRFYTNVEEWFTELSRVNLTTQEADGDSVESVSRYLETMLESASGSLSELNRTITANESDRVRATEAMKSLGDRLSVLVDQLAKQQELMRRLGDAQIELRPILGRLTDEQAFGRQELVTALRTEFKNLGNRIAEVQLQSRPYFEQLARETAANRQDLVRQIRSETEGIVKSLARGGAHSKPE